MDEQSSTGKKLVEIYGSLGIELLDQNGQLRNTFDIFTDLSAVWPNLTTNQKEYIALVQAGGIAPVKQGELRGRDCNIYILNYYRNMIAA